jgi:hypothetical protein
VEYTFAITILTSMGDDSLGQGSLDEFLSPAGEFSVMSALEADSDLGGTVEYALVIDVEQDQVYEYGGQSYVGAEIVIAVGTLVDA